MIKIEISNLPNGKIPLDTKNIRNVIMLLNENIASLKRQLESAQRAIMELQRK